jgi:malonate transporter and related proteins
LLLGVLAGWRGDEDVRAARSLNTMVLTYALPLLLFAGTVSTSREALAAELPMAGALFAGLVGPYVAAYLIARYVFRRDLMASALTALSFGFPAIAFTGLPILTPLIGDRATAVVAWSGMISNVITLPVTLVLLSIAQQKAKKGQEASLGAVVRRAVLHALREPVVIAPLCAILLVVLGVHVPSSAVQAMKLLGGTVGGVSLFASGVILQAQGVTLSWPALVSAVGRVLLVPGLAWFVLAWLHADATLTRMIVLALALASAPMQVILSVRYGAHQRESAAFLLYSNILCFPALSLFIAFVS